MAMLLLLASALMPVCLGTFPTSFGGCPAFPAPGPLRTPLSASLHEALERSDLAARLIQERGIDPVTTGLQTEPTAAIAVGVVHDQTLLMARGYGKLDINDPQSPPPDKDTAFRIGSISKIFASLATLVSRDQGLLHLDDEIVKHVPEFSVRPLPRPAVDGSAAHVHAAAGSPPQRRGITFEQLMTHMAGLSRESPCDGLCAMDDELAFARIANTTAILPPDTLSVYSNLGFDVLGHAVARVRGSPDYAKVIDEVLVKPLGLTNTGVNITEALARPGWRANQLALPYLGPEQNDLKSARVRSPRRSRRSRNNGANDKLRPCGDACLQDFGWSNPSGSMYSSVADMARLMSFIFGYDDDERPRGPLVATSLREMLLPRFYNADQKSGFALTWELYRLGDYMLRTKRGDVDGYASEIIMAPELKLGLVVLASQMEHAQATAQTLMGILLPAFDAALRDQSRPQPSAVEPRGGLARFVGVYASDSPEAFPATYEVALDPVNGKTLLMGDGMLQYIGQETVEAEGKPAHRMSFRFMPWPGQDFGPAAPSCIDTTVEEFWKLVHFTVGAAGSTVSLQLDEAFAAGQYRRLGRPGGGGEDLETGSKWESNVPPSPLLSQSSLVV
eukprot:TRINITY_DN61708_c0_g1_i1.p1 TRINITY_DN61708_c0_g1~~TRINITY_DN61708_c0_g1_i1.p1  ORF type:complete len:618 (+),score=96.52 TRINITY_DN61708_c0_g1_i1:88-1941(+)